MYEKIAPAFVKAKKEFGPALKDKTNPAFRSKYADLGTCLEAVEDALLNNGIALIQETSEDATGVTVETVFLHESGETIRGGKLHVPAAKQDPQGYGSALTYARRYSVMAACGIAPEDDDGNAATKATQAVRNKPTDGAVLADDAAVKRVGDVTMAIQQLMRNQNVQGAFEAYQKIEDAEERTAIWANLSAPIRRAIKDHGVATATPKE